MHQEELQELVRKYLNGTASEAERSQLQAWYQQITGIKTEWLAESPDEEELLKAEMFKNILEQTGILQTAPVRRFWPRIAAAASVIIALSAGGYLLFHQKQRPQLIAHRTIIDIAPGGNKAILTLANGHQIVLTGARNGKLARQGNIAINKTADGEIAYNASPAGNPTTTAVQYNSMVTPRGGQYHLTLADGTNVWLNAASSIKYPTAFSGKNRQVEVTGEAYFEVVHNAAKPFRVVCGGQTIEDIGTRFDISAYPDEPVIKTTLLEGSVKVTYQSRSDVLKPGQEAVLKSNVLQVRNANTEAAVAWKNGYFMFDSETIQGLMRQLSRWYDIDVTYQGDAPIQTYSGNFSRFGNISQVLEILEKTHTVHFRIEGRRVTVMK